ncbi:MAG: DMT family transporter [Acidimicrobiaceae bacterium]|nr:DMT family transporter [Acidimicrobiaceae bacterium]
MSDAAATADTGESVDRLGITGALVAVTAWGLSGVISKHIDMGGIAIAAYRFVVYFLALSVFMHLRGTRITVRMLRLSLWGGLALGVDVALFFSAVKHTSVANATIVGALQPVLVAIVAHRFFGERIRPRDIGFGSIALVGAVVVVLNAADSTKTDITGDIFAVGALFAWAAYFIFSKLAKGKLTGNEYTIGSAFWVGVTNVPLAFLFGQDMSWPSAESWMWLLILAFGAGIMGHSIMNWAIQQIPLWVGSTFTLFIPPVAAFSAWIFLGEQLTATQMVAMAVVVLALGGVVAGQASIGNRPRPLRR